MYRFLNPRQRETLPPTGGATEKNTHSTHSSLEARAPCKWGQVNKKYCYP